MLNEKFNVATGIFKGFNDNQGIMLCGYEWGGDEEEQDTDEITSTQGVGLENLGVIFSNKAPHYGVAAESWPYDRRIRNWFKIWGHELDRNDTGGPFEKCILQTNWCDTQARNMHNQNYSDKLLDASQVKNFLSHVQFFKPRLILFFGSSMINFLNSEIVLGKFCEIMGPVTENINFPIKPFDGKKFKVGFQSFQNCDIVSLPHPSGSRGLSDDYIALFSPEIGEKIREVKKIKQIL